MKKGGFSIELGAIIAVFAILMIVPIVLSELFPIVKLVLIGFFCLGIYTFVRNIIGPGILGWVIAGILIYILVIRLWYLYAAMYMVYLVASLGLTGIIFFGLQGIGRKIGGQEAEQ